MSVHASAAAAVLVLNAGSSSIKYALFDRPAAGRRTADAAALPGPPRLAGQIEGLAREGHAEALKTVIARLREACGPDLALVAVAHRVVHGGTRFVEPVWVDAPVMADLEALSPLAPLHQPHNLAGIRAAQAAFPGVPQLACFDTAFHARKPEVHARFALPQAWHAAGVQRYGFHGSSCESVMAQLQSTEPTLAAGRVVIAHLGNGASMTAVQGGQGIASTMSFSPLDGLTMGTRCGRLDAAVVLHALTHLGLDVAAVERVLTRESGLLGLSGLSADMRTLLASETAGARLALDHFVESVLRELAGLAAALRGLDTLVFTGGIGENAAVLRARIVQGAAWMGLALDESANVRGDTFIDTPASAVRIRVIRTQEEAVMARAAFRMMAAAGA